MPTPYRPFLPLAPSLLCAVLTAILPSCSPGPKAPQNGTSADTSGQAVTVPPRDTMHWHEDGAFEQMAFPIVDDNVHHDTLVTQVTIDLKDGTYVMVASSDQETFEGLRLFRYRLKPDGKPQMLAVSSPAYDSWTMLPTFFRAAEDPSTFIVLANFGEKQSWGQKAMLLNEKGFSDLCFLDVALPERVKEGDTTYIKLHNAAPRARITEAQDRTTFEFAGDSLYLYDDLRGGKDYVIAASRVRYEFVRGELKLAVDGKALSVPKPS